MQRVVRDGKTAVLYSPGFGAGWSTWNQYYNTQDLLFDSWIVDILLNEQYTRQQKIERTLAHCALKYPEQYTGGVEDLVIEWVPQGTEFMVEEYDGAESIVFKNHQAWVTA